MGRGNYRHYVAIQQSAKTVDAAGDDIETWETIAYSWCLIKGTGVGENVEAAQKDAAVTYRIEMPYRSDLKPEHRLSQEIGNITNVYEINGIMDMEGTDRELVILAKRTVK